MSEIWKVIAGYEGFYEVSSLGNVKRLERMVPTRGRQGPMVRRWKEKILKATATKKAKYLFVSLCKNGVVTNKLVHRLVCEAFHGYCQKGFQCAHLDGTRDNNVPENLKWVTPKENQRQRRLHGRANLGENAHQAILSKSNVIEIRRRRSAGEIYRTIAEDYGVHLSTIQYAVTGKNWQYVEEGL